MNVAGSSAKSASLTNVTVIYAVGNLASKLISFVLVFFTTYYLTKEDLGVYDIILTTAALVTPIIYIQLTDAMLRWLLNDSSSENTSKVLTNTFFILMVMVGLFTVVYGLVITFIAIPSKIAVFLLFLSSAFLPLMQITARGNAKNGLFAGSSVVYSLVYTIFTLLLVVVYGLKVDGILYANIAANLVTFLFIFLYGKYYSCFDKKLIDLQFCKELILFSFPLIPNALAWWAFSSANRYIVLYFLGLEQNGIWSISYKIPTIFSIFTSIFFMAWQEKAIREYNNPDRDRYYTEILNTYVTLSLGIILVLAAASKPLLYFIVEKSFFVSWKYTIFLMVANFFQSLALFYGVGYYCVKETKHVFYTTLVGSLTTIIFSILLVPFFNLYGAGIATMLGFLAMFLIRLKQTRKYFRIDYPVLKTSFISICIIVCCLLSYSDAIWVQVINNLAAVAIAVAINWKFILGKLAQLRPYFGRLRSLYV
jgi:O-antigen/teichoic acid export membrane protein